MNTLDLEQLVAFAESGNLGIVAERFSISQPSVTRTMQRLEAELGADLFTRSKNKIKLNEVGHLAAEEAKLVLSQLHQMKQSVSALDRQRRTISIASCEVFCIAEIVSQVRALFGDMTISSEIKTTAPLLTGLEDGLYDLAILPFPMEKDGYLCKKIGEEHLMVALPDTHRLAKKKALTFADMNGENMLLYSEIGFWKEVVHEKMPDSRFLIQSERYTLQELMLHSSLPYFVTEKTVTPDFPPASRTAIPLTDAEANPSFYLVARTENKRRFRTLF